MANQKCPNCGACKECGAHPPQMIPYPVYPYVPYRPHPWVSPYTQPRPYWGAGSQNISVGGMQSSSSGHARGVYQNLNQSQAIH